MSDKEKHNRRNQDEAMEEKWEISASRCSDCMCDGFYVSMCRQGRTGENFSKCAAGDGSGVWDTAVRYFYGDHSRI